MIDRKSPRIKADFWFLARATSSRAFSSAFPVRHLSPVPHPSTHPLIHKAPPLPPADYGALCGFSGYKNRHKSEASECLSNSANSTSIKVTNCSFVSFIFSRENSGAPSPPTWSVFHSGPPLVLSHHVTICSRGGNFAPENTTRTLRKSCEKERPTCSAVREFIFFAFFYSVCLKRGRDFAVSFYNLGRRLPIVLRSWRFSCASHTKATLLCEKFFFLFMNETSIEIIVLMDVIVETLLVIWLKFSLYFWSLISFVVITFSTWTTAIVVIAEKSIVWKVKI